MLESGSKNPRSLEDLSSDEEDEALAESASRKKCRKKIKIESKNEKESLKEVKKRPLERKVESEEEDDVKRYKLSKDRETPPKESKTPKRGMSLSSSTSDKNEKDTDPEEEEDDDDEANQKTSPKRLTLPLMSEIVPESPINESSPKRKDAHEISIENLQHDKMKEKERVDDLLKDL